MPFISAHMKSTNPKTFQNHIKDQTPTQAKFYGVPNTRYEEHYEQLIKTFPPMSPIVFLFSFFWQVKINFSKKNSFGIGAFQVCTEKNCSQ